VRPAKPAHDDHPNTAIGNATRTLTGTVHAGDAVAQNGESDATTAFNLFAGLPFTDNLTGQDLGSVSTISVVNGSNRPHRRRPTLPS
jgi:hypothetical protein